ncbi:MAG: phosphatidylglycerophosphatase A [Rubrivivax sp.]|nr:phosphatidylglycerophosphatase A [Rubrivivax sp.]
MRRDPAHWIAFGLGSGLARWAPGTVGTLWAWVAFLVLERWLGATGFGVLIGTGTLLAVWACTRTAQHLGTADPGAIVCDEVLAFWTVLWVLAPASWWTQAAAFVLFRFFDTAKPGPVGWADRYFKQHAGQPGIGWRQGLGILVDDFVAALCTLLVMAVVVRLWD